MCLLLCALAVAAPVWPELSPGPPSADGAADLALVVGIDDYAAVPDVTGAEANARAWIAWFEARGTPVAPLLGADATREELDAKIAQLVERGRTTTGRVWLVFVGHGSPSYDPKAPGNRLWLWDVKNTPASINARSVDRDALLARLKPLRGGTLAVIDACFSGSFGDGTPKTATQAPGFRPTSPTPGQATVLAAASGEQFAHALPGLDRPAFSYLVLGALQRGWAPEVDSQTGVSASEAVAFARDALLKVLPTPQDPVVEGADVLLAVPPVLETSPHVLRTREVGPATARRPWPFALGGALLGTAAVGLVGGGVMENDLKTDVHLCGAICGPYDGRQDVINGIYVASYAVAAGGLGFVGFGLVATPLAGGGRVAWVARW